MRASRPETGDDAPSLLPDPKLTEATLGDTKDLGWDVLSLPLPPVSRGTRLEINEKPPAAETGGLHPRCFFFFPQVCELNPISLGGKLREPYFGLEESSPSPRTGPPFSGGVTFALCLPLQGWWDRGVPGSRHGLFLLKYRLRQSRLPPPYLLSHGPRGDSGGDV